VSAARALPLTVDVVPKDREEKEEELLEAVLRAGLLAPPPPLRLDQIEDMCVGDGSHWGCVCADVVDAVVEQSLLRRGVQPRYSYREGLVFDFSAPPIFVPSFLGEISVQLRDLMFL
jgi:hypothetical protein